MRSIVALVLLLPLLSAAATAAEQAAATPAAGTGTSASTAAAATATAEVDSNADAADDTGPRIYLVARLKLTGTDLTQVVFFRHKAISTLEDCEAERTAGLTTGWNYYNRYYLKTLKGISYKVDYRCTQSEQHIAYWRRGVPLDHFYLVNTGDKKLKVQSHANFFACRNALKRIAREESIDVFCSISSQAIVADKS